MITRSLASLILLSAIGASAPVFAQEDDYDPLTDPLSMPYQDEDTADEEVAPVEAAPPGASETQDAGNVKKPAQSEEVDFFDTLDFLGEAERNADGTVNLDALPGVSVSGGRKDSTPGWDIAVFRGLDKVTARVWKFEAEVNKPASFERFQVTLRRCNKQPAEETPNTTAFVQVDEIGMNEETRRVFSGWMFASSPGLNAVEHPVYDVWLIDCKMADPSRVSDIEAKAEASAVKDMVPAASLTSIAD
jgi:hypothetical protein